MTVLSSPMAGQVYQLPRSRQPTGSSAFESDTGCTLRSSASMTSPGVLSIGLSCSARERDLLAAVVIGSGRSGQRDVNLLGGGQVAAGGA
jgi:hypothetical protein